MSAVRNSTAKIAVRLSIASQISVCQISVIVNGARYDTTGVSVRQFALLESVQYVLK